MNERKNIPKTTTVLSWYVSLSWKKSTHDREKKERQGMKKLERDRRIQFPNNKIWKCALQLPNTKR